MGDDRPLPPDPQIDPTAGVRLAGRGGRLADDRPEPARAEFALRLGGALAELGLPVPQPQPTRGGALWCWLGGLRLALFEFVDGRPLSDRDLSAAGLTERVAGLAAGVHGATGALAVPVPFAETFEVWTDGLRGCLAELEQASAARTGWLPRRGRWWPQQVALLGMQQRVQALGDAVGSRPRELVLCHGDLRGDNLLGDRAGRPASSRSSPTSAPPSTPSSRPG
ncbi:MAG TPA: phosphotransferase, partial [Actinomycetota bacterium]|nr:phosphotransferase [Actinomycetota bacterium]